MIKTNDARRLLVAAGMTTLQAEQFTGRRDEISIDTIISAVEIQRKSLENKNELTLNRLENVIENSRKLERINNNRRRA